MGDRLLRAGLVLVTAAACACGDDHPAPPTCADGELAVEGVLDGEDVSARLATWGYAWINLPSDTENAYMEVYGEGSTVIAHMEWGVSLAHGQRGDASGWIDLSSQGELDVGNCAADGFVSEITAREDGADFYLQTLHRPPYCGGAAVDGYLVGCVRVASF
jgi:hypothetical protein